MRVFVSEFLCVWACVCVSACMFVSVSVFCVSAYGCCEVCVCLSLKWQIYKEEASLCGVLWRNFKACKR